MDSRLPRQADLWWCCEILAESSGENYARVLELMRLKLPECKWIVRGVEARIGKVPSVINTMVDLPSVAASDLIAAMTECEDTQFERMFVAALSVGYEQRFSKGTDVIDHYGRPLPGIEFAFRHVAELFFVVYAHGADMLKYVHRHLVGD